MVTTIRVRSAGLIAAGSLFLSAQRSHAQRTGWRVETYLPHPTASQLNGIAAGHGLTVAVGERGVAVVSTGSGSTWSLSATGIESSLRGVAVIDKSTAVAVGLRGLITRTADGGRTWAAVSSPVTSALRAVAFLPNGVGVAVGDSGVLLRTEDRGLGWVRLKARQTASLRAVTFVSPTNVVALGDDGVLLLSRDVGLSWERRPSGTTVALRGVAFLDGRTGVAIGGDDRRWRVAQVILRTSDGGVSWRAVRPVSDSRLYGLAAIGPANLVAVGETGTVLRSADAGATWTAQMVGQAWLSAITAVDSGRAVAVGSFGAVWRTPDAGTTWASVRDSPTDDIRSLAAPAPNVLVVAAGNEILRSDSAGPLVASRLTPPSKTPVTRVTFATPRLGLATTVDGHIYRTTDGGVSWRQMVATAPTPTWAVSFAGEQNAFAVGGYGDSTAVIRSSDAGISWSNSPSAMTMVFDVASLGSQLILAVGTGASILRTGDGGRTWAYVRHGLTRTSLRGVTVVDSTTAVAVGYDGTVLRSADAGRTWRRVPAPTAMHLMAVAFADSRHGAAVGYGGTLIVTDDAGRTWRAVSTSLPNTLNTIVWRGPDELLAGGEVGLVLRAARSAAIAAAAPPALSTIPANLTTDRQYDE